MGAKLAYMGHAIKTRLTDAILVPFTVIEVNPSAQIRHWPV